MQTEDGSDAGWEEYYDYTFPDEQIAQPQLAILQFAHMWKKQKMAAEAAEGMCTCLCCVMFVWCVWCVCVRLRSRCHSSFCASVEEKKMAAEATEGVCVQCTCESMCMRA